MTELPKEIGQFGLFIDLGDDQQGSSTMAVSAALNSGNSPAAPK